MFLSRNLFRGVLQRIHYSTKAKEYFKMSHSANTSIRDQQKDMFFGSEVLNRVSFLRENSEFLSQCATHPSARFIVYSRTNPLINKTLKDKLLVFANGDNQSNQLPTGIWSQQIWRKTINQWVQDNRDNSPDTRDGKPTFVFLGLEDESVGLDLSSLKISEGGSPEKYLDFQGQYQGIPYFAVEVSECKELVDFFYEQVPNGTKETVFYTKSRKHYLGFNHKEAALYSHGKMYLDWLNRNLFCPGCGSKVIPVHGGGKLKCTNNGLTTRINSQGEEVESYVCPVKNQAVSNISFPRTDAVIITAITNTDRSKILLSLSKKYEFTKMYACTAGFMEPSETVEVATKREIWEETGVWCSKIDIVLTQPWPFPANLMIGCMGIVEFNGKNEVINLGHDKELADARWFDTDQIRKWIDQGIDVDNPEGILLPSPESIAFSLIKMAVDQRPHEKL